MALHEAFLIGEEFIGSDTVTLILGDNIFYGSALSERLTAASDQKQGATVFAYQVTDPERYGVVQLNEDNVPVRIDEKPADPTISP